MVRKKNFDDGSDHDLLEAAGVPPEFAEQVLSDPTTARWNLANQVLSWLSAVMAIGIFYMAFIWFDRLADAAAREAAWSRGADAVSNNPGLSMLFVLFAAMNAFGLFNLILPLWMDRAARARLAGFELLEILRRNPRYARRVRRRLESTGSLPFSEKILSWQRRWLNYGLVSAGIAAALSSTIIVDLHSYKLATERGIETHVGLPGRVPTVREWARVGTVATACRTTDDGHDFIYHLIFDDGSTHRFDLETDYRDGLLNVLRRIDRILVEEGVEFRRLTAGPLDPADPSCLRYFRLQLGPSGFEQLAALMRLTPGERARGDV